MAKDLVAVDAPTLRALMARSGLKDRAIARVARLTPQKLSHLKAGRNATLPRAQRRRLAFALGCSEDALEGHRRSVDVHVAKILGADGPIPFASAYVHPAVDDLAVALDESLNRADPLEGSARLARVDALLRVLDLRHWQDAIAGGVEYALPQPRDVEAFAVGLAKMLELVLRPWVARGTATRTRAGMPPITPAPELPPLAAGLARELAEMLARGKAASRRLAPPRQASASIPIGELTPESDDT